MYVGSVNSSHDSNIQTFCRPPTVIVRGVGRIPEGERVSSFKVLLFVNNIRVFVPFLSCLIEIQGRGGGLF